MAHKIHLRQGKGGTTACASRGVGKDGKIIYNSRNTYRNMGVTALTPEEFRAAYAINPNSVCAHCCDRFTPMMNQRRAKSGKPFYKNAMTKELA